MGERRYDKRCLPEAVLVVVIFRAVSFLLPEVIGRECKMQLNIVQLSRTILFLPGKFPGSVEEMLAFVSYLPLAGDGGARGDGIIPREAAVLEGSNVVELPTSKHSGNKKHLPLE